MATDRLKQVVNAAISALESTQDCRGVKDAIEACIAPAHGDLRVVIAGEFNSGKSMLANALLGRPLLKSSAVPTTAFTTRIRFGLQDRLFVTWKDGSESDHPLDCISEVTTLESGRAFGQQPELVTVFCSSELLRRGTVIVDTPGFHDAETDVEQSVEAIKQAEILVWVLRATDALRQQEREQAQRWLSANPGALIVPVLNMMNLVEERSRALVRQRVDRLLIALLGKRVGWLRARIGSPFLEIDVLTALETALSGAASSDQHFAALEKMLSQPVGDHRERIKAHVHVARAQAQLSVSFETVKQKTHELRASAERASKARRDYESRLLTSRRRLSARYDAAIASLGAETEKRLESAFADFMICLKDEPIARLEKYASSWGEHHLRLAAESIAKMTADACQALASDFLAGKSHQVAEPAAISVRFRIAVPSYGMYDGLRNFFGANPTEAYIAEVKARARQEWDVRVKPAKKHFRVTILNCRQEIEKAIEDELARSFEAVSIGWDWQVTDEFVEVKGRQLWIARGAPQASEVQEKRVWKKIARFLTGWAPPSREGPHPGDLEEARRRLEARVAAGKPVARGLLDCELAWGALHTAFLELEQQRQEQSRSKTVPEARIG